MVNVSAIVLAAGLSTRMGSANKLLLPYKGLPIVHHVIQNIIDSGAYEVIVVTSELTYNELKTLESTRVKLVDNVNYKMGMTTSIQSGVKASSTITDGFMICLGDQPHISTANYDEIISTFTSVHQSNSAAIVMPSYEQKKGNPVILSSFYTKDILNHQEMNGCKAIIQINKQHVVECVLNSENILKDIDTPKDYENLIG